MSSVISAPASTQVMASRPQVDLPLRAFRTLHLWIGLSVGLLLVVQGVTGAVLVWRPDLDRLFLPQVQAASQASSPSSMMDTEFRAVEAAVPGSVVRSVRLANSGHAVDEWTVQKDGDPSAASAATAKGGKRLIVYTSAATGALLAIRGQRRDALQFLVELHHNLLLGPVGRNILGVVAVATTLMALSGLWLWWPDRWTASRFRPRAAARPLHYALGFWTMWPLLAIAVSAMYFVWRQPVQRLFRIPAPGQRMLGERHTGPDGPVSRAHAKREHRGSPGSESDVQLAAADHVRIAASEEFPPSRPGLTEVLAAAQIAAHTAVPGSRLTLVRLPEKQHAPYVVFFAKEGEIYRVAPNSLTLQRTGTGPRVTQVSLWKDLPRRQRFLEWLPRVHQAEFGGWPVKLVWSFTGIMPAVLYISGFLMWRRRSNADRSLQRRVS